MQHIEHFDRLYGELKIVPDNEYMFSELIETRSSHFGWKIEEHIHPRLYQLFFVEKGKFVFRQNKMPEQMEGPCLILVPPTLLHGFDYEQDVEGRVLSMTDAVVESVVSGSKFLTEMLDKLQIVSLNDEDLMRRIKALIGTIDEELFNRFANKKLMMNTLLQQLFLVINRVVEINKVFDSKTDVVSLMHFRKFKQIVRQVGLSKNLNQIATDMGITAVHLNRICRSVSGKSSSLIVQEQVLDEAAKFLKYTSYSVSEIAYRLNFEYPNYFARFFKKHMGMTPKEFRRAYGVAK